jgi:hypothetical protein
MPTLVVVLDHFAPPKANTHHLNQRNGWLPDLLGLLPRDITGTPQARVVNGIVHELF